MNAVIQTLRSLYESFLNLPHHRLIYIAAAAVAVLLIGIPLLRSIFSSRRNSEQRNQDEASYPSVLGLAAAPVNIRPAPVDFTSAPTSNAPFDFAPAPPSNVTPINESLTVPCTHCGVTMSPRQDFCPACGYAQPMKQSFTA